MPCAALGCKRNTPLLIFCGRHLRKLRKLGVPADPLQDAIIAIAKAEGYLVPDPLLGPAKHVTHLDPDGTWTDGELVPDAEI